ncbi:hypothetical protein P8625_08460 [Tenacibaculum tangerinum]|uniref:Uncharacterized protein n=1 Tax=Tenacibaculum tangerinum TaxID=3038772 RepID=A0ABY8KY34_9FLAO|nr:hypothetical protein [Tenacibaculum tangerinum]WGH74152.1 hypothetical protein P8625_08460 [Tenacibaculum tangerinum]
MKSKFIFLVPVIIAAIILTREEVVLITLKPMGSINFSSLLVTFPIILALTERFNELFIVDDQYSKERLIKRTSLASFSVGIALALVGFRILETFMEVPSTSSAFQKGLFLFIDTVLTAAVIAGSTDGWHQLVALLQDITKSKREEVKNS